MFPIASMMSLVGKKSKFFLTGCTVLMSTANCSYHLNPIRTFYPEWMSRGLVEQIDKLIQNKTQFDEINSHQSIQHLSLAVDLKELRFREQAVRTLTPSGRFIHSQGSKFSLLHAAADLDKGDVIQYLVKHLKMDIDQPDGLQQTPIMYAAQAGGIKALECLSDLGADVNKVDCCEKNVLFHLTAPDELRPVSSPDTFHEDAIKLLVSKGVHIDHTDNRGMTAAVCAMTEISLRAESESPRDIDHDTIRHRIRHRPFANWTRSCIYLNHQIMRKVKALIAFGADCHFANELSYWNGDDSDDDEDPIQMIDDDSDDDDDFQIEEGPNVKEMLRDFVEELEGALKRVTVLYEYADRMKWTAQKPWYQSACRCVQNELKVVRTILTDLDREVQDAHFIVAFCQRSYLRHPLEAVVSKHFRFGDKGDRRINGFASLVGEFVGMNDCTNFEHVLRNIRYYRKRYQVAKGQSLDDFFLEGSSLSVEGMNRLGDEQEETNKSNESIMEANKSKSEPEPKRPRWAYHHTSDER